MNTLNVIFPLDTSKDKKLIQNTITCIKNLDSDVLVTIICKNQNEANTFGLDDIKATNISVIYEDFENVYQAFNFGIRESKADFVSFIVVGCLLEKQYKLITAFPEDADFLKFKYQYANTSINQLNDDNKVGTYYVEDEIPNDIDVIINKAYRRKTLIDNKILFRYTIWNPEIIFNTEIINVSKYYKVAKNNCVVYTPTKSSESDEVVEKKKELYIRYLIKLKGLTTQESLKSVLSKEIASAENEVYYNNIDLVFPYVTADDETWQKQYKIAMDKNSGLDSWKAGIERFRDPGTLKYFFRAIQEFLPWIRQVHMIVAYESQVPNWINREHVHIITHDQFIPNNLLPTFNSTCIEMFLGKLPDVSESFIYTNDDCIFTRPLSQQFFFEKAKPVYQVNMRDYKKSAPGDRTRLNCYNVCLNVKQSNRVVTTQHGPIPYRKSWINKCYNKHTREILESCTQFRDEKNLNQYFFALFQMMECEIENDKKEYKSIIINEKSVANLQKLDFDRYDELCLNDSNEATPEMWSKVIKKLDNLLPKKSKFEV